RVCVAALVRRDPRRGTRELLAALDEAGVPTAIASTAPGRWVMPAAERLGLRARVPGILSCRALFRATATGDAVSRRKPAPDVYLEAARQLGVNPSRSVAIEDSAPGVAAA